MVGSGGKKVDKEAKFLLTDGRRGSEKESVVWKTISNSTIVERKGEGGG